MFIALKAAMLSYLIQIDWPAEMQRWLGILISTDGTHEGQRLVPREQLKSEQARVIREVGRQSLQGCISAQ